MIMITDIWGYIVLMMHKNGVRLSLELARKDLQHPPLWGNAWTN